MKTGGHAEEFIMETSVLHGSGGGIRFMAPLKQWKNVSFFGSWGNGWTKMVWQPSKIEGNGSFIYAESIATRC